MWLRWVLVGRVLGGDIVSNDCFDGLWWSDSFYSGVVLLEGGLWYDISGGMVRSEWRCVVAAGLGWGVLGGVENSF